MPRNSFNIPQNNAERAELWEEFDTLRILRASDALTRMLSALDCSAAFRPNELREDLAKLHRLVMNQQEYAEYPNIDPEVFDLADSIDSRMYDVQEAAKIILKAVTDLMYLLPDPDEDYEEE